MQPITFSVKTTNKQTYELRLPKDATILNVKQQLSKLTNTPAQDFVLQPLYPRMLGHLPESATLQQKGITNGTILLLKRNSQRKKPKALTLIDVEPGQYVLKYGVRRPSDPFYGRGSAFNKEKYISPKIRIVTYSRQSTDDGMIFRDVGGEVYFILKADPRDSTRICEEEEDNDKLWMWELYEKDDSNWWMHKPYGSSPYSQFSEGTGGGGGGGGGSPDYQGWYHGDPTPSIP